MTYYETDLARIHHEAFGDYADQAAPGVIRRLGSAQKILELGCGSGSLTRRLLEAGFDVRATDASPAMVDLARSQVPGANPSLLVLPDDPIGVCDAVVAVGTVFNYLESEPEILVSLVAAAEASGLVITDMLDLSYADSRAWPVEFFHEGKGWKLWTINRLEAPNLIVRDMTMETGAGRTREVHQNVLVDVERLQASLADRGFEATTSDSFGNETLPDGFAVIEIHQTGPVR